MQRAFVNKFENSQSYSQRGRKIYQSYVNSEFQSKFCLNLLENDKNLKTLLSENILKTSKYKAVTVKDFSMLGRSSGFQRPQRFDKIFDVYKFGLS